MCVRAQAMAPPLFDYFPGYPNGIEDVTATIRTNRTIMATPNVKKFVRDHFACEDLEGAELEDYGTNITAGAHWEERLFMVRCSTHH